MPPENVIMPIWESESSQFFCPTTGTARPLEEDDVFVHVAAKRKRMNDMSLNLEERLRRIPADKNVATAVITATKPIPEYAVRDLDWIFYFK